jgi:D-hydroxyproline dehydrogenase subunit alpha
MNEAVQVRVEVAVVGAGPAGIAAATVAAECGASVALLDDNPGLGGQIWRGETALAKNSSVANWFARAERSGARRIHSVRIFHLDSGRVLGESPDASYEISFNKLILATGAREQFLPFPGWTLPNVFGAGGLQALAKSGLPVAGKRVVIAGTGPLLLAVAQYIGDHGGEVVCIAEQTSWSKYAAFGASLLFNSGKLRDAARLSWSLRGVRHWKNCWPVAAMGKNRLESVRLSHQGLSKDIPCDYLACGFHLIPNTELAEYAGCEIRERFAVVDGYQQSSVAGIYCAGELTGIGGLDRALLEGQIAGYDAAGRRPLGERLFASRDSHHVVVEALKNAFALREDLKLLPNFDTLVCRCEDVSFGKLQPYRTWREAKLQTRCGMGPCQGKVCGTAAEFLFGWKMDSPRPPLFPVPCSSLAAISHRNGSEELNGESR